MAHVPTYLSDPSFDEEHRGPLINRGRPSDGRDPSPQQIAARAAAIRQAYPRSKVGSSDDQRWQVPVVVAPPDFSIDRVA